MQRARNGRARDAPFGALELNTTGPLKARVLGRMERSSRRNGAPNPLPRPPSTARGRSTHRLPHLVDSQRDGRTLLPSSEVPSASAGRGGGRMEGRMFDRRPHSTRVPAASAPSDAPYHRRSAPPTRSRRASAAGPRGPSSTETDGPKENDAPAPIRDLSRGRGQRAGRAGTPIPAPVRPSTQTCEYPPRRRWMRRIRPRAVQRRSGAVHDIYI